MKTTLKIFGIVIVVILAVAIIVPMALKPKIGEIVKREANAMLNARLDFDDLDISLLRHFPHASLELKGLALTGVDRFEGDTIVAADRVSVVVNLMSIFGDSGYEVTKVLLNRPAVHAHKLADGAVNWDVMKTTDEEPQPAEEAPAEEESASSEEPSSFKLQVRDLRINDGRLSYEDDSTNMSFAVAPMDLCGRPYLSWDGEFSTEKIGDMASEMVREFFYAVSYSAGMNLHIKVLTPGNSHHMAEAMFKSFAKALDQALSFDERITDVLSTKGSL